MVRVTEVTDEEAPLALLVDNNEMALYRMNEIFRQRDYRVIECQNGDKAVDIFTFSSICFEKRQMELKKQRFWF